MSEVTMFYTAPVSYFKFKLFKSRDSPGSSVVKILCFHCRGAWAWFLVGELRSFIPGGTAKNKFSLIVKLDKMK